MTEPSCRCVSDTKDTTRSTLPPRATAEGRRSLRSSCLVLEMRDFTEDTNDLRACVVKTIVLTWDFISTVVNISNQAWQQAELSLSRGGLGIRSLSRHSPAAYIASLSSSGAVPLSQEHLIHAVELFNSLVPSSEAVSMEEVLTSRIHQKVLSNKIDNHLFNILYEQSSAADRARLFSVSSPHAASWVSVIPSEGLGLHLQPSEFQVAIKWWLGLDTSCGSICPLCPGRVLDLLGHHALTCKHGGDVVTRHPC